MKKPVNDLTSFDVSKRSPEQIAQLFARWKEQRRRQERVKEPAPVRARSLRIMPRLKPNAAEAAASASDRVEHQDSRSHSLHYSADFAAILDGRRDTAAAQQIKNLGLRAPARGPRASIAGHPQLRWALAGAASVVAVTAVAGTVLWPEESSIHRRVAAGTAEPVRSEPAREPAPAVQAALPLLPAVTRWAGAEPSLQVQLADLARWPSAGQVAKTPLLPMLKPDVPAVQTASDDVDAAELASGIDAALEPAGITAASVEEFATAAGDTARAAIAGEDSQPARTTSVSAGLDPRDNGRLGRSDRSGTFLAGLDGDKSAPDQPSGSAGSDNPGTGGAAGDGAGGSDAGGATGGGETGGDSSGGGSDGGGIGGGESGSGGESGGGESGSGGESGGESGGGGGGGDSDRGEPGGGGESGGESGGGGDSEGESGGGESGGSEGGEGGGGDSGGDGDSEGGDSEGGESDGESGEGSSRGGLRGAVGGVLGGARDAIGGLGKALGGKDKGADGGKDNGKDGGKGKGGGGKGGGND